MDCQQTFQAAWAQGDLSLVESIANHNDAIKYTYFRIACLENHVQVASLLITSYNIKPNKTLYIQVCAKGFLDMAQLLLIKNPILGGLLTSSEAFTETCKNNHIHVAEWIFANKPSTKIDVRKIFRACNTDTAIWIIQNHMNVSDAGSLFKIACKSGNLIVAQTMINTFPDIDVHRDNERIFRIVCYQGHLQVAKWLLTQYPSIKLDARDIFTKNIDTLKYTNEHECTSTLSALGYACWRKHMHIVQWLLQRNDVSVFDVFIRACYYVDIEIMLFLVEHTKYSEISCHLVDDNGYIVSFHEINCAWKQTIWIGDRILYVSPCINVDDAMEHYRSSFKKSAKKI